MRYSLVRYGLLAAFATLVSSLVSHLLTAAGVSDVRRSPLVLDLRFGPIASDAVRDRQGRYCSVLAFGFPFTVYGYREISEWHISRQFMPQPELMKLSPISKVVSDRPGEDTWLVSKGNRWLDSSFTISASGTLANVLIYFFAFALVARNFNLLMTRSLFASRCLKCGYSMDGLRGQFCPECGTTLIQGAPGKNSVENPER